MCGQHRYAPILACSFDKKLGPHNGVFHLKSSPMYSVFIPPNTEKGGGRCTLFPGLKLHCVDGRWSILVVKVYFPMFSLCSTRHFWSPWGRQRKRFCVGNISNNCLTPQKMGVLEMVGIVMNQNPKCTSCCLKYQE